MKLPHHASNIRGDFVTNIVPCSKYNSISSMVELKIPSSDSSSDHTSNLLSTPYSTTSNECTNGITPGERSALLNDVRSHHSVSEDSGSDITGYNEIVRINVGGGIFEVGCYVCLGTSQPIKVLLPTSSCRPTFKEYPGMFVHFSSPPPPTAGLQVDIGAISGHPVRRQDQITEALCNGT
eukprot:sb/3471703/